MWARMLARVSLPCGADRRAPEHRVAVIEHGRLAWRDAAGRLAKADPDDVVGLLAHRCVYLTVCTQLNEAIQRPGRRQAAPPYRPSGFDLQHAEGVGRSHCDGPRHRLDG